jgi:hypothetical protein
MTEPHDQPRANKPDAVNPAMALWFAVEVHWRRVTDLNRLAMLASRENEAISNQSLDDSISL